MKRRLLTLFLILASPLAAQISTTPGWHRIPNTAVCGGGPENNTAFTVPDNFPQNLNASYAPFYASGSQSASFTSQCFEYVEDSNSGFIDTTRHRLVFFGGGHQHYWGNDIPFVMDLNKLGTTQTPLAFALDYPANPFNCDTSLGGCATGVTNTSQSAFALLPCAYTSGCFPTADSMGSVHTYDGLVYDPTHDRMYVFGGASTPNGNASQYVWYLPLSNVPGPCPPTCNNPGWVNLGQQQPGGTFFNPGGVGVRAHFNPKDGLIYGITQSMVFKFDPGTNTMTSLKSVSVGYHSMGVLDPDDQIFISIGPPGSSPQEGLYYFAVGTGATGTLVTPMTTNCGPILQPSAAPNLPAGQYQGVQWDPIAHQVVVYPNGGNTIYLLDPKTWTCTSETYGSTQGTDYPNQTPLPVPCGAACGTFGHFLYDAPLDAFLICNDPHMDCFYLKRPRGPRIDGTGTTTLTNQSYSVAQVFRQGDIPQCVNAYSDYTGAAAPLATTQTDMKNRWPDGSLKFAIVSFTIPSIAPGQRVRIGYYNQASCNNTSFLSQSQMLGSPYNYDAQIQLAGAHSAIASANTILTAAGSCTDPGSDPDGSTALCKYWLKGPIVTAVILEDRASRTYDMNVDGTTPSPMHPIFESWFYPGTGNVVTSYTLENSWASTTAANSARDQSITGVTLTYGATNPTTVFNQTQAFTMLTRTRWNKTFCSNGTQFDCFGANLHVDHDWAYMAQTGHYLNWDTSLVVAPSKIASEYSSLLATPTAQIVSLGGCSTTAACNSPGNGTGGGVGYIPAGLQGTGAAEYHGPLTTWQIVRLLTQCDAGNSTTAACGNGSAGDMAKVDMWQTDIGGAYPIWYREADHNAGHGQTFDNSGIAGNVETKGRVLSINARTQINAQTSKAQTCNTNFAADWINFGGAGEDLGVFNNQVDSTHWPNLAYTAYLLSGRYTYYEMQMMQSAYAVADAGDYGAGGSRACVTSSGGGANRQGAAGYWEADQERGTDWQAREHMFGLVVAIDNSPEQAYFKDKFNVNLALWEGLHGITNNVGSTYATAWTFGNTNRTNYPAAAAGNLGSWTLGAGSGAAGAAYIGNYPMCYADTTAPCPTTQFANAPLGANAHFQNAYSGTVIGWMDQLGLCPRVNGQCPFLNFTANYWLNEALNPIANIFHLADYVYPTLDHTGGQITSWTEAQTFYVPGGQATAWPACFGAGAADEWYVAESAAAMSFLTGYTSSQGNYSGATAYTNVWNGALKGCYASFQNFSPKWDIQPRSFVVGAGSSSSSQAIAPSCSANCGGTYANSVVATVNNSNAGTTIMCYTLDGSAPQSNSAGTGCANGTSLAGSSGNISISATETLNVIAGVAGETDSAVLSDAFTLQCAVPTFSPGTESSQTPITVSASTTTSGATLCYTTDGTLPTSNGAGTCTHGTTYSGSFNVNLAITNVNALATKSGFTDSAIGTASYAVVPSVPAPSFAYVIVQ